MKLRKQRINLMTSNVVPWLRRIVARLSLEPHFHRRQFNVEFVLFKALLVPSHQRSKLVLICNKCYISLATDNIGNK
jgi:hypothetical protein